MYFGYLIFGYLKKRKKTCFDVNYTLEIWDRRIFQIELLLVTTNGLYFIKYGENLVEKWCPDNCQAWSASSKGLLSI